MDLTEFNIEILPAPRPPIVRLKESEENPHIHKFSDGGFDCGRKRRVCWCGEDYWICRDGDNFNCKEHEFKYPHDEDILCRCGKKAPMEFLNRAI